jgi:hypothetical protein
MLAKAVEQTDPVDLKEEADIKVLSCFMECSPRFEHPARWVGGLDKLVHNLERLQARAVRLVFVISSLMSATLLLFDD